MSIIKFNKSYPLLGNKIIIFENVLNLVKLRLI